MNIKEVFPTSIGYLNDIEFTNKILPISRKIIDSLSNEELNVAVSGYKNTHMNDKASNELQSHQFIVDYILKLSKQFAQNIGFEIPYQIETELLVARMEQGGRHEGHTHPNVMLSGLCYLDIQEGSSPIVFDDPRAVRGFNGMKAIGEQFSMPFYPKTGDILIWEGWLPHRVPTNESKIRETMVFNVVPKYVYDY